MRFSGFIGVFLVAMALGLIGCSSVHSQNYSQQNQWLATNYPDRASHLNQIATAQPYFRDDVIAGQIQLGMTIDEVLIASDTTPFGPKRYKGKFWCENVSVDRCDNTCQNCEGMIFLNDRLVWFSGHFQPPTVVDVDDQLRQNSIFTSPPSAKFQIAEALYRNEIIIGMSLTDVGRVLNSLTHEATFSCDNTQTHIPSTCDPACNLCKIEISPKSPDSSAIVIFLQPVLGEYRIFRIENQ
jgi:hypothetical protein